MSLMGLWSVSLGLTGAALIIMMVLIIARFIAQHRADAQKAERNRLMPLLMGEPADALAAIPHERRASPVLADLVVELIQMVRGGERARLVETVTALGTDQALRVRLASGSVRARITAAEALAAFPDDAASAALLKALDDRDADVRLAAALALAQSDRAPSPAEIVSRLALGTHEQSLLMVALLGELARTDPQGVRALITEPATPGPVRAAAVEALGASGDYTLVPTICDLAVGAAPDDPELPRYLRALGDLQHPSAAPAILFWFSAKDSFVRSAAAEAAGKVHMVEAAYPLLAMLDDEDWWVRFRAGEALVRLGEPGLRLLAEASRCGTPRATAAARLTLAEQAVPVA